MSRGLLYRAGTLLEVLRLGEAEADLAAAEELAERLHQPVYRLDAMGIRASFLLVAGRLDEAAKVIDAAFELMGEGFADPFFAGPFWAQLVQLAWERGEGLEGFTDALIAFVAAETTPIWSIALAMVQCETREADAARPLLERITADAFRCVGRTELWSVLLSMLSLVCLALDDRQAASHIHALLEPYAGRLATSGVLTAGPVDLALGRAATVLDDFETAERHYIDAVGICERIGALGFLARTRLDWARMLAERDRPGDRARAAELAHQARISATELGLTGVIKRADDLLTSC